jgi:hypothetical protein
MATRVSQFSNRNLPVPVSDSAYNTISLDFFYDITAAQIVLNDVIDIGVLPAGHTVSDAILIPDDLDANGTPTLALDVGLMSGAPGDGVSVRTCGAELFAADVSARTGAISRMSLPSGFKIKPSSDDRSIGVKIQAAAATAAAGRIRLRLFVHPADSNLQF